MNNKKYWEIERVLDKRIDVEEGLLYQVHWHGYPREEASWISVSYFSQNNSKLAEYEASEMEMMNRQNDQIGKLEGFIQNKLTHITAIADTVANEIEIVSSDVGKGEREEMNGVTSIRYDANRHKIDDGRGHKCPNCPYTAKRRDHLNAHLETHDEERVKKHKCPFCIYSTNKYNNLVRHVTNKHGGKGSS